MDPLSIAAGVGGLLTLVIQTVDVSHRYIHGVRHAKESAESLIAHLRILQTSLQNLEKFVQEEEQKNTNAFQQTSAITTTVQSYTTKIETLRRKLDDRSQSRMQRLLWPLSEEQHKDAIESFRVLVQWVNFTLSIDTASLLSKTKDDVEQLLRKQLKGLESMQTVLQQTSRIEQTLEQHVQATSDVQAVERRTNALNWLSTLSTIKHLEKHDEVKRRRVPETGQWFLQHPSFVAWQQSPESVALTRQRVLWCHGSQGSGKSVLASNAIDNLQTHTEGANSVVAFLYFDYQEQKQIQQTQLSITSSILRQLASKAKTLPQELLDAIEKHCKAETRPGTQDILEHTRHIAASFEAVYIVIDALDECDEAGNHRKSFLDFLQSLAMLRMVRILITSRQYPTDIQQCLREYPQIAIEAHKSDLHKYVQREIRDSSLDDLIEDDFAQMMEDAITARSHGSFLLPVLQVREVLSDSISLGQIEDRLLHLPADLEAAFKSTIDRIQTQGPNRRSLAMKTLLWLTQACRPLSLNELSDALAIVPGTGGHRRKDRIHGSVIINSCHGLVILDENRSRIRLVHFALQDFLERAEAAYLFRTTPTLAEVCLTYLMYNEFSETGPCDGEKAIRGRLAEHHFLGYAAGYWGEHISLTAVTPKLLAEARSFLSCRPAVASANQIDRYRRGYRSDYWTASECNSYHGAHLAAQFGLTKDIQLMISEDPDTVDVPTMMRTTPLIIAASGGHTDTVAYLLEVGANPRLCNWYGNALHCATEAGQANVIPLLIKAGVDINGASDLTKTPLECALDRDSARVVEVLLDNGARPYGRGELEMPILYLAAFGDCLHSVRALLMREDIHIEDPRLSEFTALHMAVRGENPHVVRALLEAGADRTKWDPDGLTALQLAHKLSFQEVIREFGVDPADSDRRDSASDDSDASQIPEEEVD